MSMLYYHINSVLRFFKYLLIRLRCRLLSWRLTYLVMPLHSEIFIICLAYIILVSNPFLGYSFFWYSIGIIFICLLSITSNILQIQLTSCLCYFNFHQSVIGALACTHPAVLKYFCVGSPSLAVYTASAGFLPGLYGRYVK